MTDFAAADGQPKVAAPGRLIYRDPHETSLPLLVLGGVIASCEALQLVRGGNAALGFLPDWQTAAIITFSFAALWLLYWRRAANRGMTRPAGFGLAALIGLAAVLPPFVVTLIFAGPFLPFGLGLAAAGLRLRNLKLTWWALIVGGIGVFEGFFGITNRLPTALWAPWEHPAIYLALGLLSLLGGIFFRVRERRAAR
jgi:hypothetical protein